MTSNAPRVSVTTLFHCSDLHFGHPAVPEQYEAIEAIIESRKYDVVAISGDVSQRARAGEFQRARSFIQRAERAGSEVIVVPGNHDVAWWRAPLGFGDPGAMYGKYRAYISPDIEPVLRIAGATFVGLNTSQGVIRETLTWNLRDISIIGHLTRAQIERARDEFERSRADDARIIVMHHNPVKGELSQRHGLKQTGVRNLAGIFLGTRIPKGTKTTNWAARRLTPQQITYAATDAWVCRELYLRFQQLALLAVSESGK